MEKYGERNTDRNESCDGGGFVLSNGYATEGSGTRGEDFENEDAENKTESREKNKKMHVDAETRFSPIAKRTFGRVPEPGSPEKRRFDTALCSFGFLVCGFVCMAGSSGTGTLPGKPDFVSNALAFISALSLLLSAALFLKYRMLVRTDKNTRYAIPHGREDGKSPV